jgi:hypothetical protein
LIDGALTLTSITLRAPHLTEDNYREAELFFGPLIAREDRAAFGNERTVRTELMPFTERTMFW